MMNEKDMDSMNKHFGPSILVGKGNGDLTKVVLKHTAGSSAEIYLNGGHVTSFKNSKGEELIFMSTKAIFKEGKAIRGGIPVCWPQFGPGELPQHGFARSSLWKINVDETKVDPKSGSVVLSILLEDSEETKKVWPHCFSVKYNITLQEQKTSYDIQRSQQRQRNN